MILKQLLNGRQHSDFIIIKDNLQISGIEVLKQFITDNLTRGNNVHLFLYENDCYPCLEELRLKKGFHVYDCFQDPWNWIKDSEFKKISLSPKLIETKLQNGISNVIIIDSLYYTLLSQSIYDLCRNLRSLMEFSNEYRRVQVITMVHMELLTEESIEFKQINRLANSVIDLKSTDKGNKTIVTHRKYAGKTIEEVYFLSRGIGGNLEFDVIKNEEKIEALPEIDPTTLTTFKLSLEDKEKESRSQVILPYLKNSQSSRGKIFYEPDKNDDWDDEDPDDDLEL